MTPEKLLEENIQLKLKCEELRGAITLVIPLHDEKTKVGSMLREILASTPTSSKMEAVRGMMEVLEWISERESCLMQPINDTSSQCISHNTGYSCQASQALTKAKESFPNV